MSTRLQGLSINVSNIGGYVSIAFDVDQGFLVEWLLNLCLLSGRWRPSFTVISAPRKVFTVTLSLDPRNEGRAEWTTTTASILFDDDQLGAAIRLYRDFYVDGRSDTDHVDLFFRPISPVERDHLMLTLRGAARKTHTRR